MPSFISFKKSTVAQLFVITEYPGIIPDKSLQKQLRKIPIAAAGIHMIYHCRQTTQKNPFFIIIMHIPPALPPPPKKKR